MASLAAQAKPSITSEPQSQTVLVGTNVSFSVTATDSRPLNYRWYFNGTALTNSSHVSGSTAHTLILTGVLTNDAGSYFVTVSNQHGMVTSAVATLTVLVPVTIAGQPTNRTTVAGSNATFTVVAQGTQPFGYRWLFNGVPLTNSTHAGGVSTSTLTVSNVNAGDGGNYRVVVTNSANSATSSMAVLTVVFPSTPDSFNPSPSNHVYAIAVQPDGKFLVGGEFTTLGGQSRLSIGRFNPDGTVDSGFNPSADHGLWGVMSLAVQPDGKILVGGSFSRLCGQSRTNIGRLNADGTLDTGFNPGANDWVTSLVLQADGKILVSGGFTLLGGQDRKALARLNPDGTLDASFNPGATATVSSATIRTIAVQADGKIVVGGYFASLAGQSRANIGRLNADGTLDGSFNPGANREIFALAVQADGKILAGGTFTGLGGQTRMYLGRLNSNGTLDAGFNPGADSEVYTLALQANGKILVGGSFSTLGGLTRERLGRLDVNGVPDPGFNPGVTGAAVEALTLQQDGAVLVGGIFTMVGGQSRPSLARLTVMEPATQLLAFDGLAVNWQRGGSGPEVWRTFIEYSTNGSGWLPLGAGTRTAWGWERLALLPSNVSVRARGFAAGGFMNGSGGLVETITGPPVIVIQPTNRFVAVGTAINLSVAAQGSLPLNYQWRREGTNLVAGGRIAGVTTASLTISNALQGDSGLYSVVVTNALGSVISSNAAVSIGFAPSITSQPQNQSAVVSNSASFAISITGTSPLVQRWYFNSAPLSDNSRVAGSTTTNLTISNVQPSDAGNYFAVVTNAFGSVTSAVATLTVLVPVTITSQPTNQLIIAGSNTTFSVVAQGTQPLAYRWFFNNAPLANGGRISGANTATLAITGTQTHDAGGYFVVISNAVGAVTSAVATLTVDAAVCLPPPSGLVGWWSGEGNALDSAGTNHGTLLNGTAFAAGKVGQAFNFDGVNDRWEARGAPGLNFGTNADFSIETWIKAFPAVTTFGVMSIVGKRETPNIYTSLGYELYLQDGKLACQISPVSQGMASFVSASANLQDGTFHHVALTMERLIPTGGKLYVDGQLVLTFNPTNLNGNLANSEPLRIGNHPDFSLNCFFKGLIDEVSIYNRALSTNEIQAIYHASYAGKCSLPPVINPQPANLNSYVGDTALIPAGVSGSPPLTYRWFFNNAPLVDGGRISGAQTATLTITGNQTNDAGGYFVVVTNSVGAVTSVVATLTVTVPICSPPPSGLVSWWSGEGNALDSFDTNHGVLAGNATYAAGRVGQGFVINGNGGLVSVGNPTNLQLQDFTIEAWIKRSSPTQVATTSDRSAGIFCYGSGGYALALSTAGLPLLSKVDYNSLTAGPAITDTNFHHLAVTKVGTNVVFYVDSVAYAASPYASAFTFNTSATIGEPTGFPENSFWGRIDEVSVYNRALSTDEIQAIYNAANIGKCLLPPVIHQQPADVNTFIGGTTTFTANVSGSPLLQYQWFFNSTPLVNSGRISGATTAKLTITNTQTNDVGGYFFIVTNAIGAVTSTVATLDVGLPPVIALSPVSQTNIAGSDVVFSVTADSAAPLTYRWRLNGANLADNAHISGATNDTLQIISALASQAGNYTVVVANPFGSVTSAVATLTLLMPASVATQPVGRSVLLGLPTTFSAVGSGDAPLAYQWLLNGAPISDATNSSFTIASVGTNHLGGYQFAVSNVFGMATSSVALLTAGPVAAWGNNSSGQCLPPPNLSNVVALAGGSAFSLALKGDGTVVAWGSGAGTNVPAGLSNIVAIAAGSVFGLGVRTDGKIVAWGSGNGTNVPVTASNVVIAAGSSSHGLGLRREGTVMEWSTSGQSFPRWPTPPGISRVTAISDSWNSQLAVRSNGTVIQWGGVEKVVTDYSVVYGISNAVSVAAGYSWNLALKSDGRIFAWGTGTTQTNVPASLTNAMAIAASGVDQGSGHNLALRSNGLVTAWGLNSYGQTTVPAVVSNVVNIAAGSTHSLALVSGGAPVILRPPVGGTTFSGSQFTLSATVAGQLPLNYSWSLNGTNIPNTTNTSFVIANAQPADAGLYQFTASNALGVAASVHVPVTVVDSAPFVLSIPTNRLVYFASPLVIETTVAGSGPMQFQWRLNGTNIAGATNGDLFLPFGSFSSGNYTLAVSNAFGSVLSSNVVVKLLGPVVAWGSPTSPTSVPASASNAIAVAISYYGNPASAIALKADGTVVSWNYYGLLNVAPGLSNVMEIAAGGYLANGLALKTDGRVSSWGNINAAAVATLSNVVSIEADDSASASFLRADGSLTRLNYNYITNLPTLTNILAMSPFNYGFLALRADGTVYVDPQGWPGPLSNNVMAMAAGGYRAGQGLLLRRNGSLVGWGPTNLPPAGSNCLGVAASNFGKLAIRSDGTVAGWSSSSTDTTTNVPAGLANVSVIDAGDSHVIALLTMRGFPQAYLSDALDTSVLVVSSKGSSQWFGQTGTTHDGLHAAQSGFIGDGTASSMRLWITGPMTVSFWWKVSSETNHDFLSFSAKGVVLTNISGETGWQPCTVNLPSGNQILQWTYSKDSSGSAGQDAGWVDQLVLTPHPPVIVTQPTSQTVWGGSNVVFNVAATGTPPLTYRWQKDTTTVLFGTNQTLLTLLNVNRARSGTYSVVVTNAGGTAISSNAVLTVLVPQRLGTPVVQPDGSLLLSSSDADGGLLSPSDLADFEAQASTNLTDWVTLTGALSLTNGMLLLQDPAQTNYSARYYRIVEQ